MLSALLLVVPALGSSATDPDPALRGLDPVLLCEGKEVPGREDLEATHGRFDYRFAGEESRARFRADLERWAIQWGGGCGRMGPLSGVGSPERWAVHEGRIWIFASDGCRSAFLEAPERFVVPPAELPPVTASAREAGSAWIERAAQAHGGAGAIDRARALRLVFEGAQSGWTSRLELVFGRDGELLRRATWTPDDPEGAVTGVSWVLAQESFVDEGDASFPVTSPDQRNDLRRLALREPLALLWGRDDEGFLALHLGAGDLGGEPVEDLLVQHEGLVTTLHVDPGSGRVRGLSWRGRPLDGVTRDVVETFTGWREVDGVLLPVDRRVSVDGKPTPSLAVAWNTIEILSELPPDTYARAPR